MNRPLKQAVREYYEQRALPEGRLERLEALMNAVEPRKPAGHPILRTYLTWSAAAAVVAFLALIALFPPGPIQDVPITERIALEVARNHIRLKPLDVETDSMEGIRRYFDDLEFVPVQSTLLSDSGMKLLGGRHCSIQSIPAAQLRVTSPGGNRLQTLYQTEYRKDIFGPLPVREDGDEPVTVNIKGLTVRIWVEKGLLLALAGAAE